MSSWSRMSLVAIPLLLAACSIGRPARDDDDGKSIFNDGTGGSGDGSGADDTGGDDGGDGGSDGGGGNEDVEWPEGDPTGCDLKGHTYLMDLTKGHFIEPAGVADLLLGQVQSTIALKVTSQSSSSVDVTVGVFENGEQDMCSVTSKLPSADWDDPVMSIGPTDMDMDMAGYTVTLSDFNFAAAAADDCDSLRDGVLISQLDARMLAPMMADLLGTDDPDEICNLMAGFGVTCDSCSTDGMPYCLNLIADQIPADGSDVGLEEITSSDVASNPDCN